MLASAALVHHATQKGCFTILFPGRMFYIYSNCLIIASSAVGGRTLPEDEWAGERELERQRGQRDGWAQRDSDDRG